MNLNQLLTEDTPASSVHVSHGIAQLASGDSTKPISISISDLLDDSDASDHSPYDSPVETKANLFTHTEPHTHPDETGAHAPEPSAAGRAKVHTMPHLPAIPSVSLPSFGAKKAGMSTQPAIHAASAPGLPSNSSPWISVLNVPSGSAPSVSIPELPTLDSPSVSAAELPIPQCIDPSRCQYCRAPFTQCSRLSCCCCSSRRWNPRYDARNAFNVVLLSPSGTLP